MHANFALNTASERQPLLAGGCLWGRIAANQEAWSNGGYAPKGGVLVVRFAVSELRVWTGYYLRCAAT